MSSPASLTPHNTRFARWHRRILGICLVVFSLEVGLVLLIFPWLHNWELNWLPSHSSFLMNIWPNLYFRGALSGLGLLNIYVAVAEAGRQISSLVTG